jgi:hypothetical protein
MIAANEAPFTFVVVDELKDELELVLCCRYGDDGDGDDLEELVTSVVLDFSLGVVVLVPTVGKIVVALGPTHFEDVEEDAVDRDAHGAPFEVEGAEMTKLALSLACANCRFLSF